MRACVAKTGMLAAQEVVFADSDKASTPVDAVAAQNVKSSIPPETFSSTPVM
jgi:transposase-like protein